MGTQMTQTFFDRIYRIFHKNLCDLCVSKKNR